MKSCALCGKPLEEGEGPICRACEEQIRAEALGRREELARQASRFTPSVKGKGKGISFRERGEEKSLRDFKSLAEYLEYLKGKG